MMAIEYARWWFNFGEDGPWAWIRQQISCGCLLGRGHDWEIESEEEEAGGVVYTVAHLKICQRCGSFGGFVE